MELPKGNNRDVPPQFRTPFKFTTHSPAIMESLDCPSFLPNRNICDELLESDLKNQPSLPDVTRVTNEFESLRLAATNDNGNFPTSFLLLDGNEHLKVSSGEVFRNRLGCCEPGTKVKVVSIFGNTGDGKSYTLNHTFFNEEEVFRTSCEQDSCTLGVWAAYDPSMKVICLDTEGLLGLTVHEDQRTRLLLKVLAVSDIVIYRTRSERLHSDLFKFLGSASRAYTQHFQGALAAVGQRGDFGGPLSALGPAVIIFHETRSTRTLHSSPNESPEDILRERFAALRLETDAFSSVRYVGVKTEVPPTSFNEFRTALNGELENTAVRSARDPCFVYTTLKVLNEKFSSAISHRTEALFPDQYFTCAAVCLSCEVRCECSMGHVSEGKAHTCSKKCRFQHQYGNCVYVCKNCHTNGKEVVVTSRYTSSNDTSWFGIAKYAWSGYVIECPNCGEIYRSRQFWYGNNQPEALAVRTEIQHVWPGSATTNQNTMNSGQRILDSVACVTDAMVSVSSQPTRLVTDWVADQIAPKYWKPNHKIKTCNVCRKYFPPDKKKHHCRQCGEGVCEECSSHMRPVPEKGWFDAVRVCDLCYDRPAMNINETSVSSEHSQDDSTDTIPRKCGEVVVNTFSTVVSVLEHPKDLIKNLARPTYWVPDTDVKECCVCDDVFCGPSGGRLPFHHCRDCGSGVCDGCSTNRRPVPHRGWTEAVRVCDTCFQNE